MEGAYITPSFLLKKVFNNDEQRMVLDTFRQHNDELRQLVGIDYSPVTINRYDNCLRSLTYLVKKELGKNDITFYEFTGELVRKYEIYLKTEKGLCQNTIVRYMKCIKKISNRALDNGWMKKNPFAGLKFRQPQTNPTFLSMEELNSLIEKEFDIERLNLVKDVFIFCCFTGLAFIDVQNLTKDHIVKDNNGDLWIRMSRKKTNQMCNVPLLNVSVAIIEKYKNHPMCQQKGILLPVMCNQRMNSYLKEIADLCGVKKHLSTHATRHTFATTITLANGVALENVSKMLGHTSTRMTEHYAKVLDQTIHSDMKSVQQRLSENK